MGFASRGKWQRRFQRRVVSLIEEALPGKTPAEIDAALKLEENAEILGRSLRVAWTEVQARKGALAAWRAQGGGLKDVLRVGGAP